MQPKTLFLFILAVLFQNVLFAQKPLQIDDDRQLFLDQYLIGSLDNAELRLHHPVSEGPVLYFDKPWEDD